MYCRYCGKELPSDSNFCPNCGAKQKENVSKKGFQLSEFFAHHRKLTYSYVAWCLIHIGLFLFSSPKGHRYVYGDRRDYDMSDGFYPFDKSLSDIIQGKSYNCSLLENVDVYDFSELFFYIVLIPAILFGLYKCYPYLSPLQSKLRARYNQWKIDNARSIKEYNANINAYTKSAIKEDAVATEPDQVPTIEEPITETVEASGTKEEYNANINAYAQPIVKGETIVSGPNEVPVIEETKTNAAETRETKGEDAVNSSTPTVQDVEAHEEQPVSEEEVKKMPLFRRFVGSFIDKVLILVIFVIGSIIISPYGAPGRLGTYNGLMNASPENYEYIDRAAMNRYGTYSEGVSQYYQDQERLANEPPHIGSTMELDLSITFSFILFNLLYYIIFESIISASPGKRMLGGVLLDSSDDRIGFGKALIRAICGGALMALSVYLFRFGMLMRYYVVIIVFFLIIDIPVLFSKRSLIDILTGTKYAKRQ